VGNSNADLAYAAKLLELGQALENPLHVDIVDALGRAHGSFTANAETFREKLQGQPVSTLIEYLKFSGT
jgi:hypothetical protein